MGKLAILSNKNNIRPVLITAALPFLSYRKCCGPVTTLIQTLSLNCLHWDCINRLSSPSASIWMAPVWVAWCLKEEWGGHKELDSDHWILYTNEGTKQCLNVLHQLGQTGPFNGGCLLSKHLSHAGVWFLGLLFLTFMLWLQNVKLNQKMYHRW